MRPAELRASCIGRSRGERVQNRRGGLNRPQLGPAGKPNQFALGLILALSFHQSNSQLKATWWGDSGSTLPKRLYGGGLLAAS